MLKALVQPHPKLRSEAGPVYMYDERKETYEEKQGVGRKVHHQGMMPARICKLLLENIAYRIAQDAQQYG